jgi:hypothetical protein
MPMQNEPKFSRPTKVLSRSMCDYRFIDHLQGVTTNNYNTIAISTFYSSLEHSA